LVRSGRVLETRLLGITLPKFNMVHLKMAPKGIGDSFWKPSYIYIAYFRFHVKLGEGLPPMETYNKTIKLVPIDVLGPDGSVEPTPQN